MQAAPGLLSEVYFEGKYRVGEGDWNEFVEGEHIPATKGDVTILGNFHELAPDGQYVGIYRGELPIAFYLNHIGITLREVGSDPFVVDTENPVFKDTNCGESWEAYLLTSDSDDLIEITVHNPHSFGNETAIDRMLSSVTLWSGIEFEKGALESGGSERNLGLLFVIFSIMLLGIALFSTLINVKKTGIIWSLGLVVLSAGIYFAYGAEGVSFWNDSIVFNTTVLGISMMLYMTFVLVSITYFLKETKRIANAVVLALVPANIVFLILPILTDELFYDTLIWWIAVQIVADTLIFACLLREFAITKKPVRWVYLGLLLPLIAFAVDVVGTWTGAWIGGFVSKYVFIILFVLAMIMVLRFIPNNINAAMKARELELEKITLNAQLAESRISTMMSQIRPHFIYNTLGSIEQLCMLDPPKAGNLVHNFAKYLRGNFGELDNPKPILMSQEMEHVHHYISIENVRFPDMTFTFEMNSDDFHIPALTVQPIVENAIKHGLMKLPKGGTINVVSYETDGEYCISVVDDGVGFDTGALSGDRKHLGLRNIRERLKVMVNGTLEIESTVGVGTKVLIKIPKE